MRTRTGTVLISESPSVVGSAEPSSERKCGSTFPPFRTNTAVKTVYGLMAGRTNCSNFSLASRASSQMGIPTVLCTVLYSTTVQCTCITVLYCTTVPGTV